MKHAWWEVKEVHPKRFYWYRRWREGSQTRSQYIGPAPSRNLAADLGIAMAVDQGPDLAADPGIAMAVNGHGQAREIAMAVGQGPDLAADLGIAMAVNPVDDLAADPVIELNFPGDGSILIVNVAPGAAITTTQPATAKTTSITTNGVPAGNAASRRVDVSSKMTHDQPALKVKEDAS